MPWLRQVLLLAICLAVPPGSPVRGEPPQALGAPRPENQTPGRIDGHGDPLPPRAVSRLGTVRLHHRDFVTATVFSPDGKWFASAAIDGSLIVWEWPSGYRLRAAAYPGRQTLGLTFSPDGRCLAVRAGENLGVWDLTSDKTVLSDGQTQHVAFSPDGKQVAWVKTGRTVRSCDLETGKDLAAQARPHTVLALAYDARGRLRTAEHDGPTLSLCEPGVEKPLHRIDVGEGPPLWAEFTIDARRFAFHTRRSGVVLLDVPSGKELHRLPALPEGFFPSALSPDGKGVLLRTRKDGTLQLWDLASSKQRCTFDTRTGDGGSRHGAFSPDGKLLAVGGTNHAHAASFWDTRSGKPVEVFPGSRTAITGLAFSPDGKELATCSSLRSTDPVVRLWDPETGRLVRSWEAHRFGVSAVTWTPDGTRLITCGMWTDEDVCVWNARTLAKLLALKGHRYGAGYLAVSPDGRHVASVGQGTTPDDVAVWDLKTGKRLHAHPSLAGAIRGGVAFVPGRSELAANVNGAVRLWQIGTAPGKGEWEVGKGAPAFMAISPDGRVVALTDIYQARTRLVELATGQDVWRFGDGLRGSGIAFSPDGRTVALGSTDGTIRLFDWPARNKPLSFLAHTARASHLRFSPDGRRLASAGGDVESATVLVWDVADDVRRPLPPVAAGPADIESWCTALAGADAGAAYQAAWNLAAAGQQAVPRLKSLLTVPALTAPARVAQKIRELDDPRFKVREQAEKDLIAAGRPAVDQLEAALRNQPSAEARQRLERALAAIRSMSVPAEQLFLTRALMALEQAESPSARALLRELAKGDPESRLARAARASLERLEQAGPR